MVMGEWPVVAVERESPVSKVLSLTVTAAAFAVSLSATAGLSGMAVQLSHEINGSQLVPGGSFIQGPYTVVGTGAEWVLQQDIYILSDPLNPVYGGTAEYTLDIGDDYVELTINANLLDLTASGWNWSVFYQIPAAFNGLLMGFDTALPDIASTIISFYGTQPAGHIGDWNVWAAVDPALEQWVDSTWLAPNDVSRIQASSGNTLTMNTQGIAWAYPAAGGQQTMGMRVDFTFVPAPGALALFCVFGLAGRRRR
jgi:hypothetical protein